MKQIVAFLFIGVLVFSACHPYPHESKLINAAFEQARQVYGDGENDTLLFIPELDKTSAYFAKKRQYEKAAQAALFHGYAEMDYDKAVAMNAFKEAERYSEIAHDSLTMARARYQMGRLLYYDGLGKEALPLLKGAESFFGSHFTEMALAFNMSACCYMLLREYDSAELCLSKSLDFAEECHSVEVKQKALNNYAKLHQFKGDYDQAIKCLSMVRPLNSQQLMLNKLNFGKVYMEMGCWDSTTYYYNQLEKLVSEKNIKDETLAAAYAFMTQYAEHQKDYIRALEYQKDNERYIVKVLGRRENDNIFRVQQQYNYENIKNEMKEKVIDSQRIILFLGMVLVFVFMFLMVSQKRLASIRKQEMEAKERTLFYVRQYTELLSKQGETMQKLAIVMNNKDDAVLLGNLKATVFGKKDPWDALVDVFDRLHPQERDRISHHCPELTEMEQKVVILSYFNVSRQDAALLLKTSIHSIDKLRKSAKIKTAFGLEKQEKSS